jgi:hypothetical protein
VRTRLFPTSVHSVSLCFCQHIAIGGFAREVEIGIHGLVRHPARCLPLGTISAGHCASMMFAPQTIHLQAIRSHGHHGGIWLPDSDIVLGCAELTSLPSAATRQPENNTWSKTRRAGLQPSQLCAANLFCIRSLTSRRVSTNASLSARQLGSSTPAIATSRRPNGKLSPPVHRAVDWSHQSLRAHNRQGVDGRELIGRRKGRRAFTSASELDNLDEEPVHNQWRVNYSISGQLKRNPILDECRAELFARETGVAAVA